MPVKHYSSGMYVRLAFAVSAHLDPEILMVDEVLAVGDAEFQRKCLGKMKEVAGGGRTVLFVSHNMGAIGRLCGAAIVLQEGRVYFWGDTFEAIKQYSRPLSGSGTSWTRNPPFPDKPHLRHMYLCDESGRHVDNPASSGRYGIAIEVAVPAPKKNLLISVGVHSGSLYPLFSTESVDGGVAFGDMTGICRTRVMLPDSIFMPKEFVVGASLRDWSERYDSQMDVLRFSVLEVPSLANQVPKGRIGDLQLLCQWQKLELMEG
jgi:lipopolysaccharide transport system ATP-binding protein